MLDQIRSKTSYLTPFVLTAILALIQLNLNWSYLLQVCDQSGDYALIALETEKAKDGEAWSGPYSRFHFRHPGPIVFYLYAGISPFFAFTEYSFGSLCFSQLVINLFFVFCSLLAINRIYNFKAAPIILLCSILIVFQAASSRAFFSVWGPLTLLCPLLCFLSSAFAVWRRLVWFLPLVAISATVAIHNHLGAAGFILPICLILLIFVTLKLVKRVREWYYPFFISAIIFLILNSIPIIESLSSPGWGNIGEIVNFIDSNHGQVSLTKAHAIVATFYQRALSFSFGFLTPYWLILLQCVIGIILFRKGRRYAGELILQAAVFMLALLSFSLWSITQTIGDPHSYLFWYHYSAIALNFSLSILCLIIWLNNNNLILFKAASLLVLLATISLAFKSISKYRNVAPRCGGIYEKVLRELDIAKDLPVKVHIANVRQWGTAAGYIVRLYRSGYEVCVNKDWGFMFGDNLICNLKDKAHRVFVMLPEGADRPTNFEKITQAGRGEIVVSVTQPDIKKQF